MNEVLKTIKERRSIRKFKPDMPAKEDLEKVVEAGLFAASGMNRQDPIVIAVTNKELRDKLSAANAAVMGKDIDPFYGAPAVLVVLAAKEAPTYIYDGALTMGNLMLAAKSLGLGTVWVHRAKEEFETEEWKAFLKELGVEGEYEGIGHCAIGYPDCDWPAIIDRKEGRVFWVE